MNLRVLVIDNRASPGEADDPPLQAMLATLGHSGHEVQVLQAQPRDIGQAGLAARLSQSFWWMDAVAPMRAALARARPTLIHVLDWDPAYARLACSAALRRRIPLVQSVPDFALHCLAGTWVRDHQRCTDCLGNRHWHGVVHRCHAHSVAASAGRAVTLSWQHATGRRNRAVTLWLAPTYHARRRLIDGGLAREKVIVRVPFVDVPMPLQAPREGALYVGQLDTDSGVRTLIAAVEAATAHGQAAPVDVIGDGPLAGEFDGRSSFRLLGPRPHPERLAMMTRARYLLAPEPLYRRFPAAIVDAAGSALPAIASRAHGISEVVEDGVTGLLFEPGDARDLERKIRWADSHPDAMREMGRNARLRYQDRFSPHRAGPQLLEAYELAVRLADRPDDVAAAFPPSAPPRSRS